jgi:hypothetical protein
MRSALLLTLALALATSAWAQETVTPAAGTPTATTEDTKPKAVPPEDPEVVAQKKAQKDVDDLFQTLKDEKTAFELAGGVIFGDRIQKFPRGKKNEKLRAKYKNLKCSSHDKRMFSMCPEASFFDPSARIYFDLGSDDEDEIDLFNDGGLEPGLTFAAVSFPWRIGRAPAYDSWSWGPEASVGISASPQKVDGEGESSSGAPFLLVSVGIGLTYKVSKSSSFGVEAGYAIGFSTDEAVDDNNDSAFYVGLKVNIDTKKKE